MAIRLIPIPDGHYESSANPPSIATHWTAVGEQSEILVRAYVMAMTPAVAATSFGTLYRQDVKLRQTAYNHYAVSVPYGAKNRSRGGGGPMVAGEWTWDFDTTGGTVHITNAIEEVGRYPAGSAPDQKGAIAVDGDSVKGVDVVIPAMRMGVTYKHPEGVITIAHAKHLSSITGCVNSDPFLYHAPGEVLFLGARGSDGTNAEASVNYQFAMSANATGLSFGDVANVTKKGHEFLWISYKDAEETVGGVTRAVRQPQFVYVDKVYREISLSSALGFGGA